MKNKRQAILATTVVLAALAAVLVMGVNALFTDDAQVPNNDFQTGTVDISTSPTSALVSFSNMAPGDQVTNPITVTNSGSLQLRYDLTESSTNADSKNLRDQLVLTIKTGVTTCTNAGFGGSGTQVFQGDLNEAGNLLSDRTLNSSASETLCFNVSLPLSTGNAFQNAATSTTFTFASEQTANN